MIVRETTDVHTSVPVEDGALNSQSQVSPPVTFILGPSHGENLVERINHLLEVV